jgi:hypothetical protein
MFFFNGACGAQSLWPCHFELPNGGKQPKWILLNGVIESIMKPNHEWFRPPK